MFISGIQQIGVGINNVHEAFRWYRRHFGLDVPIFEEVATASLMLPYTGGQPQDRHAILALNLQGGGGMEIWQFTKRRPESAPFDIQLGDLGIFVAKVKCKNVQACFRELQGRQVSILGDITTRPDEVEHFFIKDPWNNTFEVVNADDWFSKKRPNLTGGMWGATIGVSNMDASLRFYRDVLGYDKILFDQTGVFPDFSGLDSGDGNFRRVLLRHSAKRMGAFSRLLGDSEIELVQALDRTPRKIYEGRYWGNPGFIHLCFDITNMEAMKKHCVECGHPFTVDSNGCFEMNEAAGHFSYIEDPDGTLIEFVQTFRIPIWKKFGWYLDLRKRPDPGKPLSNWMLGALSLARVKD
jgi:catechol 2,3-dioxygenase-like lactoylglutathione lyase family enzyme